MYTYPKTIMTIPQLVTKLADAEMEIESTVEAEIALASVGYYRLRGYCFHWYNHTTQKYAPSTSFSNVLRLYNFDAELSNLVFSFLTKIEISLRARLVNALLCYNDALILNDPSVFDDKQMYWKNQSTIAAEIARSDDVFIKHNFINHDGAIPIWASVEIMSFGTLSKVIKTLKAGKGNAYSILASFYPYKSQNGNIVEPSKNMFTSWVHAVAIMRNICAHNSRIYNRAISIRPQLLAADARIPLPQYTGLYEILLAMKYLRPTDEQWNEFVVKLHALFQKYAGIYELNRLNFPPDWQDHFIIK